MTGRLSFLSPPPSVVQHMARSLRVFTGLLLLLRPHELDRLCRVARIHVREHDGAELLEVDGLGHIAVEPRVDTLGVNVAEDVCRERDDREIGVFVLLLPFADLAARLIAVFVRHVEIALWKGSVDWRPQLSLWATLTKMIE